MSIASLWPTSCTGLLYAQAPAIRGNRKSDELLMSSRMDPELQHKYVVV